ncbi:MAG: AmmeMemoRadiSam system radical SAM enzyme [Candidatus Pacebacteria bacterium]|nr:AmmeMemoRadiSam system radical SAM enzyme [Candidatus Paceibacterota bacterium]
MKKATLYEKLIDNKARCLACSHQCLISDEKTGICGVRQNKDGDLYLLVYGKPISVNVDPVEKKPLFHFLPGQQAFSLGTIGCNFGCDFCQNWEISQLPKTLDKIRETSYELQHESWLPEIAVKHCLDSQIPMIAYTYNEPTIWVEYAYEIMKLAKEEGIKNVWVSNGFMSEKTLDLISPYLDAINIDLKSFSDDFYKKICKGRLETVKQNIRKIWQKKIWIEVTTLIIPGINDSDKELKQIAEFLKDISSDIPWHISAFYPSYKMTGTPPTPKESLIRAYQIGKNAGLNYIYTGNIPDSNYDSTYCPNCNAKLITRQGIEMINSVLINKNQCPQCKQTIPVIY